MSLRKYLKRACRERVAAELRFKGGGVARDVLIVHVSEKSVSYQWIDDRGRLLETAVPVKEISELLVVRLEGPPRAGRTYVLPTYKPEEPAHGRGRI